MTVIPSKYWLYAYPITLSLFPYCMELKCILESNSPNTLARKSIRK